MRRWAFVAALILGVALIAQTSAAASSGGETVPKFDTMVGVDGPFRGATNAIRGIPGAGAPWRVDSVDGKLKSGGGLLTTSVATNSSTRVASGPPTSS